MTRYAIAITYCALGGEMLDIFRTIVGPEVPLYGVE